MVWPWIMMEALVLMLGPRLRETSATMAQDTSTLTLSNLTAGNYTFRLTVTDNDGASSFDEIDLEVVSTISGHAITDLVLVNADTDTDIISLSNNQAIDFLTIGTSNLNIRADHDEAGLPVSIRFGIDFNRDFKTDDGLPRTIGGDNNNPGSPDYFSWTPSLGQHMISATIYDKRQGLGNEGISMFFMVQVSNNGTPLPVEFGDVFGEWTSEGNRIFWETVSETDNEYFKVERSDDAIEFEEIASIPGQGNSSVLTHYSFFDPGVKEELTYYRIRQIDYDGKI